MPKYSFLLYNASNDITLVETLHVKNVRITQFVCTFTNESSKRISLSITGFDDNKFVDGVNNTTYTFMYYNAVGRNSTINYVNTTQHYDVSHIDGSYVNNFLLEIKIDGVLTPDISVNNPLFVEIEFDDRVL